MFFFKNYNPFLAGLRKPLCWLLVFGFLQMSDAVHAQDCDPPCEAIDEIDSFEIWSDFDGVCAPVSATLMSDVPNPSCGEFTYQWDIQGGAYEWSAGSSALDASPSVIFLDPVLYQVELTISASGFPSCTSYSEATYVNAAQAPEVSTTSGGEICAFDIWETLVYVNPGNTAISNFAWIVNGDSVISNSPAPLNMPFEEAGVVEVVAWVENTCGTSSDTSYVQVRALPSVAVDFDYNWFCQGAPVEVKASGADSYSWNSSALLLSGGAEGDSVAVYEMENSVVGGVEGLNDYGGLTCSASAGFQVYSMFLPGISIAGEEVICDGDPVGLESSVISYGWSTSQQWLFNDSVVAGEYLDLSALNLAEGDYSVSAEVVFDPFPLWLQPEGCTGNAQFDFSIVGLPVVTAPQNLEFCNQNFDELLPEGSPAGGAWAGPGVMSGFFNPDSLEPGTVALEYHFVDSNGCASMDTAHVLVNEPVWANAGMDSLVCESNEWGNLTGFEAVESGIWSGPSLMDPYSGLVDVGELEVGLNEFVYQVGAGSCASADTIVWTVTEHPVALLSTQGSFSCDEDTIWFEVYAGGGTLAEGNDYSYEWSDGVQFTPASDPFWIANVEEGFSFVFVEVFDDLGCSDAGSAFIEPLELPEIALPDLWQLCNQSLEVNTPGAEPAFGTWSGDGVVDSSGTFNPGLVGEGMHLLTYTAAGPLGCTGSDSMVVEVSALDAISAGMDQSICQGTPELILTDFVPIAGGWWSGEGVTDSLSAVIATSELSVGLHPYIFHTGSFTCAQRDTVTIEVLPLPSATIEEASSFYCPDDSIALSALPFGGTATGLLDYALEWTGMGIQIEAGDFFIVAPSDGPDTLSAQLIVTDALGCSNFVDANYTINPRPDLSVPSQVEVCDQSIAIPLPFASPTGGTWALPAAAEVEGDLNQIFLPSGFGIGQWPLIYTYIDGFGCSAKDTTFLDVIAPITLELASEIEACADGSIVQLPLPLDAIGFWSGPALLDSIAGSVDLAALSAGLYDYHYSSGDASCLVTDSLVLVSHDVPEISSSIDGLACPGDSVQILTQVNDGNVGITFAWFSAESAALVADGPAAAVSWNFPGTYVVELSATDMNGCSSQASWNVNIPALPEVFAGGDLALCDQSFNVVLNQASPVSSAQGSGSFYGLGSASSLVQSSGVLDPALLGLGSFGVEYVYLDSLTGCSNADTLDVVVEPLPAIFAGSDTAFCAGDALVQLEGQLSGVSATWNGFGLEEQSALVDSVTGSIDLSTLNPGNYQFQYAGGENSCFVSDERIIVIHDLPAIILESESSLCLGDPEYMLPLASPSGGAWSGPGILDALAGVFDVDLSENDYLVEYEVESDSTGCMNAAEHLVRVHGIPVADFSVTDPQCVGEPFATSSTFAGFESYAWWLEDSLVGVAPDVSVVSVEEGAQALKLVVVNEWGCADSTDQTVQWIAAPLALFSLTEDSGCSPFEVGIENASTGAIDAVQWSIDGVDLTLGSGDSAVFEQPSPAEGFILEMVVSNQCGADSMQDSVVVFSVPEVDVFETIEGGCSPFFPEFEFNVNGSPDNLDWDFGNGQTSSGSNPTWPAYEAVLESVVYSMTLTASNACGSASDSTSVLIEPALAQAQFELNAISGCLPLEITATDLSSGADAIQLSFGDGAMSLDSLASHTYTEPGTYAIVQTVSSACSVDSFALNVTVHPAFELEFTASNPNACLGDSVLFDVISSGPASDIQIQWMSPSGLDTLPSPALIGWNLPGSQTLEAEATDSINGCLAASTLDIVIHSPLTLAVEPSAISGCSPLEVTMENETFGEGEWSWFMDGDIPFSNAFSPEISVSHSGGTPLAQWIQYAVVSEWGCVSSDSVLLEALPSPVGTFQLLDSTSCGLPAIIDPIVESSEASEMAWFVDSILVAVGEVVELELLTLGNHVVELISENEFGCQSFTQDSIEVLALPEVSLSASPLMGCVPHLLEVEHSSSGATDWVFEIYLDTTLVYESDAEVSEVMLDVPGSYGVQLTAVSERGCVASLALEDSVVVLPRPSVGFYADPYAGTFDAPDPLNSSWTFENISDSGQSIWDFGDGQLSSEWHANHVYDASGSYEVLLTVINEFGCASEFMMVVEVLESLEVYVPNAFTPPEQGYADGINDGWKPVLSDPSLVDRYELVVYNRYGQMIWQTQDSEAHWVGEARNGGAYFAPGGIYTWVLQIDSRVFPESSRQWKGQVNLLR